MKTIKTIAVSLLIAPFLVFAQTPEVVLPSAGLTPESPFYFLDRLGETLREFLTFNPESKAKLQIEFAGERVSEIKIMVEEKGVNAKGLGVAKALLLNSVTSAAGVVEREKLSGKEVSALAKEINSKYETRERILAQAFLDERAKLVAERVEIKTKLLKEAEASGDAMRVTELRQRLDELDSLIDELKDKKDEIKSSLRDEKKKIRDHMNEDDQKQDDISRDDQDTQELEQEADDDDDDDGDSESDQNDDHDDRGAGQEDEGGRSEEARQTD